MEIFKLDHLLVRQCVMTSIDFYYFFYKSQFVCLIYLTAFTNLPYLVVKLIGEEHRTIQSNPFSEPSPRIQLKFYLNHTNNCPLEYDYTYNIYKSNKNFKIKTSRSGEIGLI